MLQKSPNIPQSVEPNDKNEKKKRSIGVRVTAIAAGVLVAVGGAVGINKAINRGGDSTTGTGVGGEQVPGSETGFLEPEEALDGIVEKPEVCATAIQEWLVDATETDRNSFGSTYTIDNPDSLRLQPITPVTDPSNPYFVVELDGKKGSSVAGSSGGGGAYGEIPVKPVGLRNFPTDCQLVENSVPSENSGADVKLNNNDYSPSPEEIASSEQGIDSAQEFDNMFPNWEGLNILGEVTEYNDRYVLVHSFSVSAQPTNDGNSLMITITESGMMDPPEGKNAIVAYLSTEKQFGPLFSSKAEVVYTVQ